MDDFVAEYLRLGLAFDRLSDGYVDAFTGDPALRQAVQDNDPPAPLDLARRAAALRAELPGALDPARARFLAAQLTALECAGRKFADEPVGFIDEVRAYFNVDITLEDEGVYQAAHRRLNDVLAGPGDLRTRFTSYRQAQEIPPQRLAACIDEFAGALRERVRSTYPLPPQETVAFEVVTDKPWSGFNYYEGNFHSRVAVNADLKCHLAQLPHLIAHEAYPGHHTEHCRKEELLVGAGQHEQQIFLVNTPQCLIAEGLADHALHALVGDDWALWAQEIYADLGFRFDGELATAVAAALAPLNSVRQNAAILLHDRGRDTDEVSQYLQRWSLATPQRAQASLKFLSHPLWRAYISTYVAGFDLLQGWLTAVPNADRPARFGRLLDEPLTPGAISDELSH